MHTYINTYTSVHPRSCLSLFVFLIFKYFFYRFSNIGMMFIHTCYDDVRKERDAENRELILDYNESDSLLSFR